MVRVKIITISTLSMAPDKVLTLFHQKSIDIFIVPHESICCGAYSLEA